MTKPLTPQSFDSLTHGNAREDRILWTAKAIGRRLGCGPDYVRHTLAGLPGTPIRKQGRRFFAFEDELIAFMRDGDAA